MLGSVVEQFFLGRIMGGALLALACIWYAWVVKLYEWVANNSPGSLCFACYCPICCTATIWHDTVSACKVSADILECALAACHA